MSNNTIVVNRPIKAGCRFNALNPLVYKLRRQDKLVASVFPNSGLAMLQIVGADYTTEFPIGDSIYVGVPGYQKASEVTNSVFSTGDTFITTDLPYGAAAAGYVNNLSKKPDYKVELEVFDFETNQSLAPRIVSDFDMTGETLIDISGVMRSYVFADWVQTALNNAEAASSRKIYIKYQEFYNSTYWEIISEAGLPVVAVFAFMQLLQASPPDFSRYAHGGNMLSYMPADASRAFMTKVQKPVAWRGYPFDVSFLWPAQEDTFNRRLQQFDSAGNLLVDGTDPLTVNMDHVNRLNLLDTLNASTTELLLWLETSAGAQKTKKVPFEVRDPCSNPVYLFWKNSTGGDSFWMFDESQDYQDGINNGRKVKRMTLYADNLTIDQWDALNELKSPSDVFNSNIVNYNLDDSVNKTQFRDDNQVYIIGTDGSKTGVIVVSSDMKTKTLNRKNSIEITIELPEIFTV